MQIFRAATFDKLLGRTWAGQIKNWAGQAGLLETRPDIFLKMSENALKHPKIPQNTLKILQMSFRTPYNPLK